MHLLDADWAIPCFSDTQCENIMLDHAYSALSSDLLLLLCTKARKTSNLGLVVARLLGKSCAENMTVHIESLLAYGLPPMNEPLLAAIRRLSYDAIEILLQRKYNVNATFKDGKTCLLHIAASTADYSRTLRIANKLLAHGADVLTTCRDGCNFFHYAAQSGFPGSEENMHALEINWEDIVVALQATNANGQTPGELADQCSTTSPFWH